MSANIPSEPFVIGNYDGETRKKEILEKFQKMLDEASVEIAKYREELLKQPREDVCISYLKAKAMEAKDLEEEIKNFDNKNQHFTKEYRTFQGHCGKIQTDLDSIDVLGRDDLKNLRGEVLEKIEEMIKTLRSKVHADGKACKDCPVKD